MFITDLHAGQMILLIKLGRRPVSGFEIVWVGALHMQ